MGWEGEEDHFQGDKLSAPPEIAELQVSMVVWFGLTCKAESGRGCAGFVECGLGWTVTGS